MKTPALKQLSSDLVALRPLLPLDLVESQAHASLSAILSQREPVTLDQARQLQSALLTLLCYVATLRHKDPALVQRLLEVCQAKPASVAAALATDELAARVA